MGLETVEALGLEVVHVGPGVRGEGLLAEAEGDGAREVHPRVERVLRDGARARLVRGSLARRNKVVLDLRDHSAVDVLRQLARPADVEARL